MVNFQLSKEICNPGLRISGGSFSIDHGSRLIRRSQESLLSDFFKWLIVGWSIVVVGIAALGTILVVKYGEVKKIETDDVSLCYIIVFFCWLIPIIAFTILARTLGF
jgi:hypothetical protein